MDDKKRASDNQSDDSTSKRPRLPHSSQYGSYSEENTGMSGGTNTGVCVGSNSGTINFTDRMDIEVAQKEISAELDDWITGMVKTKSFHQLLDMINQGHKWITVKGSPGEGKSTAAKMVLREIQKKKRFVFEVKDPKDFKDVTKACQQPVIVLDDILGDMDFNIAEWNRWKNVFHKQLDGKEHRSNDKGSMKSDGNRPTVILITRDYVLKGAANHMGRLYGYITHESRVINMSHLIERGTREKREILKAVVLPHIKLSEKEIRDILHIDGGHGFPHVCRLFVTMKRDNPSIKSQKFFKTPLKFLNETIEAFLQDEDKLSIFKEMIRNEGKISERELENFKLCIKQKACQLKGTYLKSEKGYYLFDHNSVYDSVSFVLGSLHTVFVIENCSMAFIDERIRLTSGSNEMKKNNDIVVTISDVYIVDLAKRFAKEIERRNLAFVLSNQACAQRDFVNQMMSFVKIPLTSMLKITETRILRIRKFEKTFLHLIALNKSGEIFKYIDNHSDIHLNEEDLQIVLLSVCQYGSVDLLNHLVERGYNLDMEARYEYNITPLMMAATYGHRDVVDRLISLGADVSACDKNGYTVLHLLCRDGYVESVKKVLDMGVDVETGVETGRDYPHHINSPLWHACHYNSIDVVKLLLSRGARVTTLVEELAARNPKINQLITSAKAKQM